MRNSRCFFFSLSLRLNSLTASDAVVIQIALPSEERSNWRFVYSKSESGGSFRVFLGEDWFSMIFAAASRDDIVATPAVTLGCIRLL